MRLLFVTDLHGSTKIWRKAIKCIRQSGADMVLLGGDITGKYPILITEDTGGNCLVVEYDNPHRLLQTHIMKSPDMEALIAQKICGEGHYAIQVDRHQFEEWQAQKDEAGFSPDAAVYPKQLWERFLRAKEERLQVWIDELLSEVNPKDTCILLMPGNDDPTEIDDVIRRNTRRGIRSALDEIVRFGKYEVASYAHVTPTPWATPREATEKEIKGALQPLIEQVEALDRAIFNFHCPPSPTLLDEVPYLKATQHVGSTAIRRAIRKYQPLVSLHGHVHEAHAAIRIGRTLAVNPGSAYIEGALRGCLLHLADDKISHHELFGDNDF